MGRKFDWVKDQFGLHQMEKDTKYEFEIEAQNLTMEHISKIFSPDLEFKELAKKNILTILNNEKSFFYSCGKHLGIKDKRSADCSIKENDKILDYIKELSIGEMKDKIEALNENENRTFDMLIKNGNELGIDFASLFNNDQMNFEIKYPKMDSMNTKHLIETIDFKECNLQMFNFSQKAMENLSKDFDFQNSCVYTLFTDCMNKACKENSCFNKKCEFRKKIFNSSLNKIIAILPKLFEEGYINIEFARIKSKSAKKILDSNSENMFRLKIKNADAKTTFKILTRFPTKSYKNRFSA